MALDAALDVSSSKPPVPPASPPRIDSWARGGRRSKRRAGSPAASDGAISGADVHDQSEQEYLALCLLMLSRGLRGDGAADASRRAGAAPTAAKTTGQQHHQHGYECSVCGKVFASYQALGGHKTSHRKPPTPPTPSLPAAGAAPGDEASSGSGGAAHAEEKEKVHQCSLCLRTFPSGQALGGHKRLHYEGGAGDGAAKDKDAATKTNKASAAAAATTAVLRDFDLNLPADGAPPEAKRARTMLLVV